MHQNSFTERFLVIAEKPSVARTIAQVLVCEDKARQFKILKDLLNSREFSYVVNACDAGREGELIFNRVYELSGSRMPVKRLWISSMEDNAI